MAAAVPQRHRGEFMADRIIKLSCRQVMRLLSDFLEGKLDSRISTHLCQHTKRCDTCRLALDSARHTLATYFTTGAEPVLPGRPR
jgi:hypothetical protein